MLTVLVIVAASLVGASLLVVKKYPSSDVLVTWSTWVLDIVLITVNHWGFNKKYKSATELAIRLLVTTSTISVDKKNIREARKEVSYIIEEAHKLLSPDKKITDVERKIMVATYVAVISYGDITETMASVWESHAGLDVKKATLIAIDILGELVLRDDSLGQEYFQHLIYGINKSLKIIRDHGTDKRALKKVTSTLFRIYKLSKAYRHRRRLGGHTEGEFYDKIIAIFEHMFVTITTD